MPAIPDAIRNELAVRLETEGVEALQCRAMPGLDPVMADSASPADRQRILRGLEVGSEATEAGQLRNFRGAAARK